MARVTTMAELWWPLMEGPATDKRRGLTRKSKLRVMVTRKSPPQIICKSPPQIANANRVHKSQMQMQIVM